jgi:xylan 1,4-beta-xylosidase
MNNFQQHKYLIDSTFLNVSVLNNEYHFEHAHNEIELIYVINGTLNVKVHNDLYKMENADFILINSNELHAIHSKNETLYVSIKFNYNQINELLGLGNLVFSCNSVSHTHTSDIRLRDIIEELLAIYIKENNALHVEVLGKTFELILALSKHYLKYSSKLGGIRPKSIDKLDERLSEIIVFIQRNFKENISLNEVAEAHFISVPYLSKFFKNQTGKTFSQYLNEIRLSYAVSELLNSDKTITRIALDNGFPNLVAFNRVFLDHYQVKPADYRKENISTQDKNITQQKENQNNQEALNELRQYLDNTKRLTTSKRTAKETKVNVVIDKIEDKLSKYWNKLINIGYAKDILNSDMQEQLTNLQKELHFSYGRIWGLLSDDMLVEDKDGDSITYNFSNTNKIIDFLVANKLKPFIDLGPKPKMVLKKIDQTLVIETISEKTIGDYKKLVKAFLLQCVERYGIEEVEHWYFEIWKKHTEDPAQLEKDINEKKSSYHDPKQFEDYFEIFGEVKRIVKEIVPSAKVGGCGLTMDLEGDKLEPLLDSWKQKEYQPDFLSISLYPIEIKSKQTDLPVKNLQSANPDFVRNKISQIREVLDKTDFANLELNVTEWNISISNRDYLNDSCFKSSYMVKNIIQNIGKSQVNMIGYWLFSDIFSNFRDSKSLLHGGAGLITKSGIKKPSYNAFVLLNQLGYNLVAKGENYIITSKSANRFQILCFNYKHFNYSYYLHPEGSTSIREQYDIFEDTNSQFISIKLEGMKAGHYRIKEQRLSRKHGSILDEWLNFGGVDDIKPDEINYLKQICGPYMKVEHALIEDNLLSLEIELEPHEVRLIELNLLYG